jgi:RNA polymerase sigma-70 factor (ECF subfamily)
VTGTIKDELLLEQARSGDQDAFLLLYERHRSPIFRFLYRVLDSAEAAEDITHDCFLSLIGESEKSQSYAPASLRTRLYKTARTLAMEYFRNSAQEPVVKHFVKDDANSRSNNPSDMRHDGRMVSEVAEAVAGLPPLEREALILFEYEDLELQEIAAIVGADVRKVAARIVSARQWLRNILATLH